MQDQSRTNTDLIEENFYLKQRIEELERSESKREQTVEALRESERRYRELSIIDDLTQLYNPRHFYSQLKNEIDRANRYEQPCLIADHFPQGRGTAEGMGCQTLEAWIG
jgi:PleD family two-component response regulator